MAAPWSYDECKRCKVGVVDKRLRNIALSGLEEGAGAVTGLPIGTLRKAALAFVDWRWPWLSPYYFLDWELEDWAKIYQHELPRCLDTFHRGQRLILPQVVLKDNTRGEMAGLDVVFYHAEERFNLRDDVKALTDEPFRLHRRFLRVWRRRYYNDVNLRLVGVESRDEETLTLVVQGVEYEDYTRTNLCLDTRTRAQTETLRDRLHGQGRLEELRDSPLANNLGINTLLSTADGSLVLQLRSRWVVVRPREMAPSSSGTLSYTDVPFGEKISLRQLPKLRETFEELGIHPSDLGGKEIKFLGLTRELIRGGQPELFFVGSTNLSERDVRRKWRDAKDRFESSKLVFFRFGSLGGDKLDSEEKRHAFMSRFDELLDRFSNRMSIPLWTNLALWRQYRLAEAS